MALPTYGFTPPNRYLARPGWEGRLTWANPMPPAGNWLSDLMMYYAWRRNDGMSLMAAWTKLRMIPDNARKALNPPAGLDRGLIPPEIFSRVLARAQATGINPNDDVPGVIIHALPAPAPMVTAARRAAPARARTAARKAAKPKATTKRKAAKPKSAKKKSAKPKAAKKKVAGKKATTRRPARRSRAS